MRPGDGNWQVSETLARLVEEQLVAAMWRLELRLYMLLAAALCASLVPPLLMYKIMRLKKDRASQQEQRRARQQVQSVGAEDLPEREPSSARRTDSRRRRRQRRLSGLQTGSASETGSDLPSASRSSSWSESSSLPEPEPSAPSRVRRRHVQTRSAPETDLDARPGTRPNEVSATSELSDQMVPSLPKRIYTLASSASSKSHSPSSREPSLRSPSRPSRSQAQDRPVKHDASRRGSPDKPRRTDVQPRWPGDAAPPPSGPPESPQPMAGVVQPVRDSFKRRVTSGSERQAENQRGLSLEDPLPPFKDILKRFFETQSQPTLSSQASGPAAMKTRPLGAATGPAL